MWFAKMWDFAIAQMILAMTAYNLNVLCTGLTHLEFKNLMETRIREINEKAQGKDAENTGEAK